MRLLVIHQNFPGQFRQLVPIWACRPGWEVLGLGRDRWQWSGHPEMYQPKITVRHEGISLHFPGPHTQARVRLPIGSVLKAGDPVITFDARNIEPNRGFHVFMCALAKIQRLPRGVHAVSVSGDGVSRGKPPCDVQNWR